jgi:hypothetical protein
MDPFDHLVCHLYRLPVHRVFADFPQGIRRAWNRGHLSAIPLADWSNLARQPCSSMAAQQLKSSKLHE